MSLEEFSVWEAGWLFRERKGLELADKDENNNCQNVTVEDPKF
jgi:hypothetical protein